MLDGHGMHVTRWSRYEVTDAAAYQPPVWTAIEFEAPEQNGAALAADLAACLLSPGRHGDAVARQAAQEHGRACGVPEPQLDWTD